MTDLYNHHLQSGKPVLWVLTGIDRADQLGNDNREGWRSTRDTNNAYLSERFSVAGGTGAAFIGEGFLPVSPAWEAQADLDEAEGDVRAAQRNRSESRMAALRDRLTELIENGTGQYHLRSRARPLSGHGTSKRSTPVPVSCCAANCVVRSMPRASFRRLPSSPASCSLPWTSVVGTTSMPRFRPARPPSASTVPWAARGPPR